MRPEATTAILVLVVGLILGVTGMLYKAWELCVLLGQLFREIIGSYSPVN